MAITSIRNSSYIADLVNFIRDKLVNNITDPLSRNFPDRFVMTSYPQREVKYPIITVTDTGTRQEQRLGMSSEGTLLRLGVEIRIWALNVAQRDELFDSVYDYLRTNQFSGDDIVGANLHDFNMESVVNVSDGKIKSKVMEVTYLFVCE